VDKIGSIPDLVGLNSPKLTALKVHLLNPPYRQAVSSSGVDVDGNMGAHGAKGVSVVAPGGLPQRGLELDHLITLLQSNTTITALHIQGTKWEGTILGSTSYHYHGHQKSMC
jgi:hypothetical protein